MGSGHRGSAGDMGKEAQGGPVPLTVQAGSVLAEQRWALPGPSSVEQGKRDARGTGSALSCRRSPAVLGDLCMSPGGQESSLPT